MANTKLIRTIAATLLGTVILGAPVTSQAQSFRTSSNGFAQCQNNQIAGGVFGAVIGGILGSELSSRRARTGSTIAGASLGAIAGSAIAGSSCNVGSRSNFGSSRGSTVFVTGSSRGFNNRGFSNRRVVTPRISNRNSRVIVSNRNQISRRGISTTSRQRNVGSRVSTVGTRNRRGF